MPMDATGYENDWGERAISWLFEQRYRNWPLPSIARETGKSLATLKAWAKRTNLPSRQELQWLAARYGKDGFSSFVFGKPCREELRSRLDTLNRNLSELRAFLNEEVDSAPAGVAGRTDRTNR